MAAELPSIHDVGFEEIYAEARARIPVHTPEWTNFNESDPGITLLQLFAFMTDNLLYRANRIPERSRVKFLRLLDIGIEPATAASGIVTFANSRGPTTAVTVAEGTEVHAGRIPFRALTTTEVLPVEGAVFYKAPVDDLLDEEDRDRYRALYTDLAPVDADPVLYETRRLQPPAPGAGYPRIDLASDTVDASLWVALLARDPASVGAARAALGGRRLTLGILPAVQGAERTLLPGSTRRSTGRSGFAFWLPVGGSLPQPPGSREPSYLRLDSTEDGDVLVQPGLAHLDLPSADRLVLWDNLEPAEEGVGSFPPLLDDTERDRLVTWVRVTRPTGTTGPGASPTSSRLSAALSWVGVNAARIVQRTDVAAERLGTGTGLPDQTLRLAHRPVLADSVRLTVGTEDWTVTDDLLAAGSEVPAAERPGSDGPARVFTVDRESGEIRFGDGLRGARPPRGAVIHAGYSYGGGTEGNVPVGAVSAGPALPPGVTVRNDVPTWGGAEAETVARAERRMSQTVRHRSRLVSAEDFSVIALETPGVDLARVEVLPLFHPQTPGVEAPGVVTVLAVPRYDAAQPGAPRPDRMFLDAICAHLDPRRLVTTELHVQGPDYVRVVVSVGVEAAPGRSVPLVRQAVQDAVRRFLSPLPSDDGPGWPLGKPVDRLEIWTAAAKVPGVGKVVDVLLGREDEPSPVDRVPIDHLELPHLTALNVQSGQPVALDALRGRPEPPGGSVLPIPSVPEEC